MNPSIAQLYDQRPRLQWNRLDAFPCEFHIHLASLLEYLPPSSRVLDIGAGPARYAIELARAGHRVTVGDVSTAVLDLARERIEEAGLEVGTAEIDAGGIEAVIPLDACDLSRFGASSFDAVVALGPFYHLREAEDRQRAAEEAARVLRPAGRLFAAWKPRAFWLSMALHTFVTRPDAPSAQLDHLEAFLDSGRLDHLKSPHLKQSWFCQPEELEPFFSTVGISRLALLASSGVAAVWSRLETWKEFEKRDPELRRRLFELVKRTSEDPHVLGMSDQILFIGERDVPAIP